MIENFKLPSVNKARAHYAANRNLDDQVPLMDGMAEFDVFLDRVRADALRVYADALGESESALNWQRGDFVFDVMDWADWVEGQHLLAGTAE